MGRPPRLSGGGGGGLQGPVVPRRCPNHQPPSRRGPLTDPSPTRLARLRGSLGPTLLLRSPPRVRGRDPTPLLPCPADRNGRGAKNLSHTRSQRRQTIPLSEAKLWVRGKRRAGAPSPGWEPGPSPLPLTVRSRPVRAPRPSVLGLDPTPGTLGVYVSKVDPAGDRGHAATVQRVEAPQRQ